jgi:hypothetical protein
MTKIKIMAMTAALTAIAFSAQAQDDDAPPRFTYATYFTCGGGPLARVDEIMAADADRMNGLVEDGTIAAWGWMAHHTGGQWQRIAWYQADGMEALLDAGDAVAGDNDDDEGDDEADDADDGPTFGQVCPNHDDYIWQVENGKASDKRGAVGMSVYHVCDINREDRADELVASHMAPILDKMVDDGELSSWGWQSHVVGGRFRKLQTMTAPDVKSLMKARGDAISALYDEDDEAGAEFSEICGPHVDYIWQNQIGG